MGGCLRCKKEEEEVLSPASPKWQGCRQRSTPGDSQAVGSSSSSGSRGRGGSLPAAPPAPRREGTGGPGAGGQKGQRFAAAPENIKSRPVFTVYSALALSLFTRKKKLAVVTITKQELDFFSGKAWISALVLALLGWSYSFYRKGLRLFIENELTKWKWNIWKCKRKKVLESRFHVISRGINLIFHAISFKSW